MKVEVENLTYITAELDSGNRLVGVVVSWSVGLKGEAVQSCNWLYW